MLPFHGEKMVFPCVYFVLQSVSNFLIAEGKFLYGVRGKVEEIQAELSHMLCLLKDADPRLEEEEKECGCISEIREDAVENYAFKVASRRMQRSFWCSLKDCITLHKVGSEIITITCKVTDLSARLQKYCTKVLREGESSNSGCEKLRLLRQSYSHVEEEDFVGMEDDIKELVARLVNDEDHQCRAVSIAGMGGLGKTTLARKVFNHKVVRHNFDAFAWVWVSSQFQEEDVYQRILVKLIPEERDQILNMRKEELVEMLFEVQNQKDCLVVLDDICSTDAWDILRPAFPNKKTGGKKIMTSGSKILLTTRNRDVALHVDRRIFLREPRCMNEKESWELLTKKAFSCRDDRDPEVDEKMEKVGREMLKRCGGLPLAIAVLGEVLFKRHTLGEWEMVRRNLSLNLRKGKLRGQSNGGVLEVLALSYNDLPYQCKPCFLYLGNFPADFSIPAEKLYHLWEAEGIISTKDREEEETMMDVAERYLGELAQRYMVQVQVEEYSTTNRKFKSCQLHELMRDLCLSKVKEENFLTIVDLRQENELRDSSSSSMETSASKIHRLSIYLDGSVEGYIPLEREEAWHVRSTIFFHGNHCSTPFWQQLKSNFNDFKMLRVLDLEGFKLPNGKVKFPKQIGNKIHLRYLNLSRSYFTKLPSSLGRLRYLQTLDLRVMVARLKVPNVLWKMENLKHLYLPYTINRSSKLQLGRCSKLETLENFDARACDIKDLFKLTNLRRFQANLWRKGEYITQIIDYLNLKQSRLEHTSISIFEFDSHMEERLIVLRKLIGCPRLHRLHIDGQISQLPEYHHFSSSITKLSLRSSGLEEDPMAILEKLPSLISLSLRWNSFVGNKMVCSAKGFPQLKFLELWELPNLVEWRVDKGALPSLSTLVIFNCHRLQMVPDGLTCVTTLQELTIRAMPEAFNNRARVVDGLEGEDFQKVRHVPSIKFRECIHNDGTMPPELKQRSTFFLHVQVNGRSWVWMLHEVYNRAFKYCFSVKMDSWNQEIMFESFICTFGLLSA